MPRIVVELTTRKEFWKFIANHRFVILRAGADWCGPCKAMEPYFIELLSQLPSVVALVNVDMGRGRDLAAFLKIKKVPFIMNTIKGDPHDSLSGGDIKCMVSFFERTLSRVNNEIYGDK